MLILLALACAHRARPDTGAGGESGDSGAARDSADTHEVCGPWSGVGPTSRWTYAASDDYVARFGFDGTFTVEVGSLSGDTVALTEAGAYSGESGEFSWTRTDTWRCDEAGAWLVRSDAETHGSSHGSPIDTQGWRTFEPGWLVRPVDPATWTDAFTLTSSINGSAPAPTDVTCTATVVSAGTWDGAGGPAEARSVTPACSFATPDPYTLGAGVGLLGTTDETLIAYTP